MFFFKPAGDLENNKVNTKEQMNSFFKPAGDLDEFIKKGKNENSSMIEVENSANNIEDYLSNLVTGKEYPNECSYGILCGRGSMIVNKKALIDMVNTGNFNIIRASYITDDMIDIEYQEYTKENIKNR